VLPGLHARHRSSACLKRHLSDVLQPFHRLVALYLVPFALVQVRPLGLLPAVLSVVRIEACVAVDLKLLRDLSTVCFAGCRRFFCGEDNRRESWRFGRSCRTRWRARRCRWHIVDAACAGATVVSDAVSALLLRSLDAEIVRQIVVIADGTSCQRVVLSGDCIEGLEVGPLERRGAFLQATTKWQLEVVHWFFC